MSVSLAAFCDRTGCRTRLSCRLRPGEHVVDLAVRLSAGARSNGWRATDDGVDLCPQHAQEAAS